MSSNPFRSAPGAEPPLIAGRDEELSLGRYAVAQVVSHETARALIFTGLRGMGKTVLLRHTAAAARKAHALVLTVESSRGESLSTVLGAALAETRSHRIGARARSALDTALAAMPRVAFALPHEAGSIEITPPTLPHTELARNLSEGLGALHRSLHDVPLVIAVDEIQDADPHSLRALVRFVHESGATDNPVLLVAAGLPTARSVLFQARTYTERFRYLRLELLKANETSDAIEKPLRAAGVSIEPSALRALVDASAGYPFFIQEYGGAAWVTKRGTSITLETTAEVIPGVRRGLEDEFYEPIFASLTPRETAYALALAELGPGPHSLLSVAAKLGTSSERVNSIRTQLVKKQAVYQPTNGAIEFRVPLSTAYVESHREELKRRVALAPPSFGTSETIERS